MQPIERIFFSYDWITLVFIASLGLLFVLKIYRPQLLIGYSLSFFKQGFIKMRSEENPPFLSAFHATLFLFCSIIFSLFIAVVSFEKNELSFNNYLYILLFCVGYFITRYFLDIFFERLFQTENITRYFRFSKIGYMYSISLWLFPILILYQYTVKNKLLLFVFITILLLVRFLLVIKNNKKLIFNNFLYFILYFCTLEIASLLILYKILTV